MGSRTCRHGLLMLSSLPCALPWPGLGGALLGVKSQTQQRPLSIAHQAVGSSGSNHLCPGAETEGVWVRVMRSTESSVRRSLSPSHALR